MLQRILALRFTRALIFATILLAPTVAAQQHGDFAPRNSLLYVRAHDVSGAIRGLLGDNWRNQAEELLKLIPDRQLKNATPLLNHIRSMIDYLGETELVIIDVMVREPHIQLIEVAKLKEGAPKEFSKELIEALGRESRLKATPHAIEWEGNAVRLHEGMMITTFGGTAAAHVKDVLEGRTEESLSRVEKWQKWNERARGHIVAWANMAAWRNALDRAGEERTFLDDEARTMMDLVEWQKWDTLEASLNLPIERSGIQFTASLFTTEPLQKPYVFFRPGGASRLAGQLPAETLAFTSFQLGTDHEKTYMDVLGTIHNVMQQTEPKRIQRSIENFERSEESMKEHLAKAKEALGKEDGDKEAAQREVTRIESQLENYQRTLASLREQLAAYNPRPFNPNNETGGRSGRTEPEQFHDDISRVLERFQLTRAELARALGQEAVAGIIDLPDPAPDQDDPRYWEDHWFVAAETTGEFDAVKSKFLDILLARNLPEGIPEREREAAEREAQRVMRYDVPGGEILCERRLRQEVVYFAGSGLVGAAANDIVARRILEAAQGRGRFDTGKLGGGTMGSKLAWVDLRSTLERILHGNGNRRAMRLLFPEMALDLRKYIPGGAYLTAQLDERLNGVTLKLTFSGSKDLSAVLPMVHEEISDQNRVRHDYEELQTLGNALRGWLGDNAVRLAELPEEERQALLKSVTPNLLHEQGTYTPPDNLRSAFDPTEREDEAAGLDSTSFQYFGLFPGQWERPEGETVEDRRMPYSSFTLNYQDMDWWVVAAMKEPWARGGRFVLLQGEGAEFRPHWMAERDYQLLLRANAEGRTKVSGEERAPDLPEWKWRKQMGRIEGELRTIQSMLQNRLVRARERGEVFDPSFDGGTAVELKELMGSENQMGMWLDVSRLKIWTTEQGVFARLTHGDIWAQYGPEGAGASWMPGS